jgi:hypothetical protein
MGGNPMSKSKSDMNNSSLPMHKSPRCGAKTRRSGKPCQCPAMANGRCRIHGGVNPGAPKGERNGNYRNGTRTNEAIAERRRLSALMRESRTLMWELRKK